MDKGDTCYYCRIIPNCDIYEVIEFVIRTATENDWYVGVNQKTQQAFLFNEKDIDNIIFMNKADAQEKVKIERGKNV